VKGRWTGKHKAAFGGLKTENGSETVENILSKFNRPQQERSAWLQQVRSNTGEQKEFLGD